MNAKSKVKIKWGKSFAYAIGLLTTDGSLSKDGRHISFTSKDEELALLFKKCLRLKNKIGKKSSGSEERKKYFIVQFGDVNFYRFLIKIGLTPQKTKTIAKLKIPKKYFFDFLRGHFDGDGTFYSYWDPRWHSSFMFYLVFVSASKAHIDWLQSAIYKELKITGHINRSGGKLTYQLKYAKAESQKLLLKIYSSKKSFYLRRKFLKIKKALEIENRHNNARVEKLADSHP